MNVWTRRTWGGPIAGLVCLGFKRGGYEWCLHFAVKGDCWLWGHEADPYLESWGLGPLFLLVRA